MSKKEQKYDPGGGFKEDYGRTVGRRMLLNWIVEVRIGNRIGRAKQNEDVW